MTGRTSIFLSFVLLSTSACTSSTPGESHVGERLGKFSRRTKPEIRAMAERHEIRERLRAEGKRVCEEGDWPQQWKEGRRSCGCDIGKVRRCSLRYYGAAAEREIRATSTSQEGSEADVGSVGSRVGRRIEKLTRRTMGELRAKADRHRIRERFRDAGARVCEEGDWPQEWWDGCKWCWCDIGEVRHCDPGPECDEEVARKLLQQAAEEELENPHRVRKRPIAP